MPEAIELVSLPLFGEVGGLPVEELSEEAWVLLSDDKANVPRLTFSDISVMGSRARMLAHARHLGLWYLKFTGEYIISAIIKLLAWLYMYVINIFVYFYNIIKTIVSA